MIMWRDPHTGGFYCHGNAQQNETHRTISDPKPATISFCTGGDRREPSRLCTLVGAVTKTSVATNQLNTESFFRVI